MTERVIFVLLYLLATRYASCRIDASKLRVGADVVVVVGELSVAPLVHEHLDLRCGVLRLAVFRLARELVLHGNLLQGVLELNVVHVDGLVGDLVFLFRCRGL